MENKTDIILISYNSLKFNIDCIESIYSTANDLISEIIVVDNASEDGSAEAIKEKYPEVTVIQNTSNLGYSKAVNIGMQSSKAGKAIVTNADVVFLPGAISELIHGLDRSEDVGVCGPQQLFPDGSAQDSYGDFPGVSAGVKDLLFVQGLGSYLRRLKYKLTHRFRYPKDVDFVDGAIMSIKREAFNDVRGFDEDYFFYTEEADFCYRLKKNGWIIIHLPLAYVIHHRGGSSEKRGMSPGSIKMLVESKRLFAKKHLSRISRKIYYSSEYLYINLLLLIRGMQRKADLTETLLNFRKEWRTALKEE